MNIPLEIYERVIDGYSQDVLHRLLALLELRDNLLAKGLGMNSRFLAGP